MHHMGDFVMFSARVTYFAPTYLLRVESLPRVKDPQTLTHAHLQMMFHESLRQQLSIVK